MTPRSIPHFLTVGAVGAAGLLWNGCTTSYRVKVDAITQSAPKEAASYRIKNKNMSVEEDNLRYKEAAGYVRAALSGRGLYEATGDTKPDIIVELDYGIDPPSVRMQTTNVPIYAQTGGGVSYDPLQVTDSKGNVSTRTVPTYEPTRTELVGYREVVIPVAVYEKYLHISARENKEDSEGKGPAELWSVNTSLEDESKDIRKYLPLLASASMESIGTDTGSQKTIKLKESDQTVGFVKKGM
jgi:hypothetical protein